MDVGEAKRAADETSLGISWHKEILVQPAPLATKVQCRTTSDCPYSSLTSGKTWVALEFISRSDQGISFLPSRFFAVSQEHRLGEPIGVADHDVGRG
jgi:hypothetical protein